MIACGRGGSLLFSSQRENFKLSLLPDMVLMERLNLSFLGGWSTEYFQPW